MVRIKFLGTGTSYPVVDRVSSSCLLIADGKYILIDIGPAVVRRLVEFGVNLNDINLIILTHFHVDHSGDLPAFLFACNYGIEPRTKPLLLIGGCGITSFFKRLSLAYPWIKPKNYDLKIVRLVNETWLWNGIGIRTKRINHNRESVAVRLDMGKSVVFSGDTDYSRNLVELAFGVDLLVVECSFPVRKVKGHLNLDTLKKIVDAARPKEVVLTHLYPEWNGMENLSPYRIAHDGMEISFQVTEALKK